MLTTKHFFKKIIEIKQLGRTNLIQTIPYTRGQQPTGLKDQRSPQSQNVWTMWYFSDKYKTF